MKWIIAALVSIALVVFFVVSNITGGIAPEVTNVTYNYDANSVSFDVSYPVKGISNQAGNCWSEPPFIHWDCPLPVGDKMKLSIAR